MVIIKEADSGIAAVGKQIRKQQGLFTRQAGSTGQFRIQLRRPGLNLGSAERATGSIYGIGGRWGEAVRSGLFFSYTAECNTAGAACERIGSDLNGLLHQLTVGIYEF